MPPSRCKTALTTAKTQTTPTELNASIGKLAAQFSALKADTNNSADITAFFTNISNAYKNLSRQTATSVATYLDNLKALSGTISTNSVMFEGQDAIKTYATAVTTDADAAKNITTLLAAPMTTPQDISKVLTDTKAAASAWRRIKNAIPQQ